MNIWFVSMRNKRIKEYILFRFQIKANKVCITTQTRDHQVATFEPLSTYCFDKINIILRVLPLLWDLIFLLM